jgi:hypothetical protein
LLEPPTVPRVQAFLHLRARQAHTLSGPTKHYEKEWLVRHAKDVAGHLADREAQMRVEQQREAAKRLQRDRRFAIEILSGKFGDDPLVVEQRPCASNYTAIGLDG